MGRVSELMKRDYAMVLDTLATERWMSALCSSSRMYSEPALEILSTFNSSSKHTQQQETKRPYFHCHGGLLSTLRSLACWLCNMAVILRLRPYGGRPVSQSGRQERTVGSKKQK
jgi:hypothetical protein